MTAAERLALAAVGGSVDSPSKRKKPKARKMLEKRAESHLSAGRVREWRLGSCYPGFHSLPPRTGREVFPHPALRQPSTCGFQGLSAHIPGW